MALLLMLWPALDLYFGIEGRPAVIRSRRPALLLALILLILPLAMPGYHDANWIELDLYCDAATTQGTFDAWLADFLAGEIIA